MAEGVVGPPGVEDTGHLMPLQFTDLDLSSTSRSMRHACAEISSGNAGAYKQQLKTVTCHALDEEVTFFSHDGSGNSRGQEWTKYLVRSSTRTPRRTRWHTNLMLHRSSGRLSTSPCGFTQAPCSGAKLWTSNIRNVK